MTKTRSKDVDQSQRRWLTLQEMIQAGQFYRVGLKVQGLRDQVEYDIVASEVGQAISKALDKHNRHFDFGGAVEPIEECTTGKVIRLKVRERTDEEALEELWNRMEGWYMQYWDADVTTKAMLRRIRQADPELYREIKYYLAPTWSNTEVRKYQPKRGRPAHRRS